MRTHTHTADRSSSSLVEHPHPPPPGWMLADPVCSMAITALIVISVYPLMKESLGTLMMRTPPTVEHYLPGAYQKVRALGGAVGHLRVWQIIKCTNAGEC